MDKPYMSVKRVFDVTLALLMLPFVLVVVAVCYLFVKYETGGSIFFIQERPGHKGKLFKIYKLRSMIEQTEHEGQTLSDVQRMTKTGRVIRKLSLDELPQIWNVLKGEMSFIGPRPLLSEYLPLYSPEQMRRHDVLPGISGWAQVNGRNESTWEKKFEQDVWYVDHTSITLDMKIIWMTIVNILKCRGINAGMGETMSAFNGNQKPLEM